MPVSICPTGNLFSDSKMANYSLKKKKKKSLTVQKAESNFSYQ